jgi:hypothetical protein
MDQHVPPGEPASAVLHVGHRLVEYGGNQHGGVVPTPRNLKVAGRV